MINLREKKYISYYIILALILVSLVFSMIFFFSKGLGQRKTFIFPSAREGKYVLEYRYLRSFGDSSYDYYLKYFVDELLLGSGVERTKKIFTPGTRVESCFLRDGILYLNLSGDLINMGTDTVNIKEGVKLLELNINTNFSKVKKIQLFIDGKLAFEN